MCIILCVCNFYKYQLRSIVSVECQRVLNFTLRLNQNIYVSSDEYDFDIIRHDFVDDYQRRNVHTPYFLFRIGR